MKTYQKEGQSDIGQHREIENLTSKGVFYGDLTKKYNLEKIKFVNNSYRIILGNKINEQNNLNLYNEFKNNHNIIEVNKINEELDFVYLLFNYYNDIPNIIKYILINENLDDDKITKSQYSIVNSINQVQKYYSNYSIYKKLLLNDSNVHLNNLLLTLKIKKIEDNFIELNKEKMVVLTLPTSIERFNNFKNENNNLFDKFNIIEGIKYNPGFIGCGYSYKMIISNASRLNLDYIKICEDDCKINNYEIIEKSIQYLISNNLEWDLLSCFIVDLNENLEIYEQIELSDKYK
jgi:hypothetical protein